MTTQDWGEWGVVDDTSVAGDLAREVGLSRRTEYGGRLAPAILTQYLSLAWKAWPKSMEPNGTYPALYACCEAVKDVARRGPDAVRAELTALTLARLP